MGPLSRAISPKLTQGFKIAEFEEQDARVVWETIVQQVMGQGCALATEIDKPDGMRPAV
jgi:hypothetical protein